MLRARRRPGLRTRQGQGRRWVVAVDSRPNGRGRRSRRDRQPPRIRNGGAAVAAVRVVLADDHSIWRSGVRADLGELFHVVGEASDAEEAIAVIKREKPDL